MSGAEPLKILSIDGGGIRGVIPARFIAELERQAKLPAYEMFDLIAGTSTGGLLALALTVPKNGGQPVSADEIVKLYQHHGRRIFPKKLSRKLKVTRASHETLAKVIENYVGSSRLSDARTDVLVPAYEIERREPFFFKSWRATERPQWDFQAVDVALATCSAPTFFDPWAIAREDGRKRSYTLMDGGIFANNPAMCAAIEARKLFPDRPLAMVSLGTGDLKLRLTKDQASKWQAWDWATKGFGIVSDAISNSVSYQVARLPETEVQRWDVKLPPSAEAMDNADPENVRLLVSLADAELESRQDELRELVGLLAR